MIVIDQRDYDGSAGIFARFYGMRVAQCPRHVWRLETWNGTWHCTRCPARGRIK